METNQQWSSEYAKITKNNNGLQDICEDSRTINNGIHNTREDKENNQQWSSEHT
jgi:hypothetical protein